MSFFKIGLTLCAALMLASCASTERKTNDSLYQRLGADQGITNIVDNLLYELGGNDKLIGFFAETNIERFRTKLIEQLCVVSDGPCTYTGDTMAQTHSTMTLNKSHFDSLVNDLIDAMDANGTPTAAQNDLLARLAPMYDEVVNPKNHLTSSSSE